MKDPVKQKDYKATIRIKNREFVIEQKKKPCVDCGIQYPPYVMDFDHLPGHVKVADISNLTTSHNVKWIAREIAKCELVCANCHRERTYRRLKDY